MREQRERARAREAGRAGEGGEGGGISEVRKRSREQVREPPPHTNKCVGFVFFLALFLMGDVVLSDSADSLSLSLARSLSLTSLFLPLSLSLSLPAFLPSYTPLISFSTATKDCRRALRFSRSYADVCWRMLTYADVC